MTSEPGTRRPRMVVLAWLWLFLASGVAGLSVAMAPALSLSDPSVWGVIGYAGFLGILVVRDDRGWDPNSPNRRAVQVFLLALPTVYVADWVRFGGSQIELVVQLIGLMLWGLAAWYSRRARWVLWAGCLAHAVWDLAHFEGITFVPEWYLVACVVADVAVAVFVAVMVGSASREVEQQPGNRDPSSTVYV